MTFDVDVGVNGNGGRSRLFRKWRDRCNFHRTQIVPNAMSEKLPDPAPISGKMGRRRKIKLF